MTGLELAERRVLLRLRCGACATWRSAHMDSWRAKVVEARLERRLRRDRREISDDLRRLRLTGIEPDDFGLPGSTASLFG